MISNHAHCFVKGLNSMNNQLENELCFILLWFTFRVSKLAVCAKLLLQKGKVAGEL